MKKRVLLLSAIAYIFIGCGNPENKIAKVVDSEVEGLEYQCAGMIEYTDKNGTLSCAHMPLAFKIGEIRLGHIYKIPTDGIILPQDIVGVDRKNITDKNVLKLTVILQSIDSDKNPENGITISKETRKRLSQTPINIKKMNLDEIKEIMESELGDLNFTKPVKSLLHLNRSMRRFNIKEKAKLTPEELEKLEY